MEAGIYGGLLAAICLVGADVVTQVRTRMSLDQVASNLAATVTQYQSLYTNDMAGLFDTAQVMAGSAAVTGADGATIITGIKNVGGTTKIDWQQKSPGASTYVSSLGVKGAAPANLPDNYAVPLNGSVIAVEVFATVTPWVLSKEIMGNVVGPMQAIALFQPRSSELPTLVAANRP